MNEQIEPNMVPVEHRGPTELGKAGCTCEFGCRSCGLPWVQMGNCPAFDPCPMGRDQAALCPVHPPNPGGS